MNLSQAVKALNIRFGKTTHVRINREWNEIQVRFAHETDYDNMIPFDLGHTTEDKANALRDTEDYCRDIQRRANTAAEDAAFHEYVRSTETR